MKQYRVYSLDKAGHIAQAQNVECRDDLDALEWAQAAAGRDGLEVWDGARLVARVKPHNSPLETGDRLCL